MDIDVEKLRQIARTKKEELKNKEKKQQHIKEKEKEEKINGFFLHYRDSLPTELQRAAERGEFGASISLLGAMEHAKEVGRRLAEYCRSFDMIAGVSEKKRTLRRWRIFGASCLSRYKLRNKRRLHASSLAPRHTLLHAVCFFKKIGG